MTSSAPKEFRPVFLLFKLMGCLDSPIHKVIYITAYSILVFVVFLGEFIGFINRTSIQEQVELLYNFCMLFYLGFTFLAIRCNYGRLLEFLITISRPKGINSDLQSLVFLQTLQKASTIIPKVFVVLTFFALFATLQWCVTPLLEEFEYHNKNFHIGPFFYQCGEDGRNRFPLQSMCIQMNSFMQYVFANTLLTILVLWDFIGYVLAFTFAIFICIFAETNITVLGERLLQLQDRMAYSYIYIENSDIRCKQLLLEEPHERILTSEFIKIIQYFQYLQR